MKLLHFASDAGSEEYVVLIQDDDDETSDEWQEFGYSLVDSVNINSACSGWPIGYPLHRA